MTNDTKFVIGVLTGLVAIAFWVALMIAMFGATFIFGRWCAKLLGWY